MRLASLIIPCLALGAALLPPTVAAQKAQVRHVVVFKFKPEATPAQIKQVTDALRALKDTIPGIVSFEHGVNNSPEQKNLGFTHAFLITFESAAARDAYLPHPEHKKFGELLGSLKVMEDVFVVDYEPAK
ncbi:MAG: Dabb family protein [Vicinamibacterales bacterium]